MKKSLRSIFAFFLAFSLMLTSIGVSYASSVSEDSENDNMIELMVANSRLEKGEDGGLGVAFDLVLPARISDEKVLLKAETIATGKFTMSLHPGNGYGSFNWKIQMLDGSYITRFKGNFACKDASALFPTVYASAEIDNYFNEDDEVRTYTDVEYFEFRDTEYQKKYQFRYSGVYVYTPDKDYSFAHNSVTGTLEDFQ